MTIQQMDHVGIVVDDLAAATAFFVDLGLSVQGKGSVDGARGAVAPDVHSSSERCRDRAGGAALSSRCARNGRPAASSSSTGLTCAS
jgi:catechol 2,3-dioxygenase-like lactoylglutathione lyase family enzyme